jgi:hypothetical protein
MIAVGKRSLSAVEAMIQHAADPLARPFRDAVDAAHND